jgi:hypothetical protein
MTEANALIFLHISKTGGSTLRSIIERQFQPKTLYDLDPSYFVSDSAQYDAVIKQRVASLKADPEIGKYRCFFHPGAYGLDAILPQAASYFTFLRDPVDHFISSFYFAVNNKTHIHHERIVRENLSIEDFANQLPPDNLQTRRICGTDPIDQLNNDGRLKFPLDETDLQKAKEHLSQMPIFGLMEAYDESLLLMQKTFHWKNVNYSAKNVAPKRMKLKDASSNLREKLETDLALDIELYHFAETLFQKHLQDSGITMQDAVSKFRQENEVLLNRAALKNKVRSLLKRLFGRYLKGS